MQPSSDGLQYIVGDETTVAGMAALPALPPFSEEALAFLNDLSARLRGNRAYPDVATFGFWCRKAALAQEMAKYDDLSERLGRGVIFHSTPSNVPVNFAFSFAAGLLAGNANLVRLPGKPFEQVELICEAVRGLLTGPHRALAPYVCFVKYPPSKELTDRFSALCDTRVVWGGDGTIAEMRQSPLPPRATEINFADRHSIAVIQADAYLDAPNKDRIAQDFYNDTYYSDQNACTAPRILFWMGTRREEAKRVFWEHARELALQKYSMAAVQAVGKLSAFYRAAAEEDLRLICDAADLRVMRISVERLTSGLMRYKYNSGFFFECDIDRLSDILPVCDLRCQTLTYLGVPADELAAFVREYRPRGVDRAVPMGSSMDFALVWDGYDLIRSLSRRFTVR